MKGFGILIGDDYDLKVEGGSLALGNTLYQNQALILAFQPGEVKSAPTVGVGIMNSVLDTDFLYWRRLVRQQMEMDGQRVVNVKFGTGKKLTIDAHY